MPKKWYNYIVSVDDTADAGQSSTSSFPERFLASAI